MFEQYAGQLPLELFVFVGAFIEEAVSPIPSFVVMIPAGAAAQVQGTGWGYLVVLAFIAAAGRIFASMLLYVVADKAEDWVFRGGRRFFGASHKDMERFGARLRKSNRDWLTIFLFNAIPVLPTSLLSLACGFIKVDFKRFVIGSYFGSAVNAFIYLCVGYGGVRAATAIRHLESVFQIAAIVIIVGLIGIVMYYRRRRKP